MSITDTPTEEVVKEPIENQDSLKPDETPADKGDKEDKGNVPYDRFSSVNERMKAAEAKVKQNADDQEALRVATLKEQGKHQTLAEEATTENAILKRENEEFKAEREERVAALIAKLPEKNQEFAAKHGLGLVALQDYSEQILNSGTTNHENPRPDSPGEFKRGDKPWGELTKAEKLAVWADQDRKRAEK